MDNYNFRLFLKINKLIGHNKWLDVFGSSGAEWVIFGAFGWYIVASLINGLPNKQNAIMPILFFGFAWVLGWFVSLVIGLIVKEMRPHITHPEIKIMYKPLMSWKSFPSDHALTVFLLFFLGLVFSLPFAWALLPLALWVCWGRVYAGFHYPFDIVGGLSLAGFISVFVYYLYLIIF